MKKIRLCGDWHGNAGAINNAKQTLNRYDLTIQLGDFGAGFDAEYYLDFIDSDKFKILFGNHDHYFTLSKYPHALKRFGILEFNEKKIFYIGGAQSIDKDLRIPGLNWWSDEELSYKEVNDCLDLYEENCREIDIIISHECPINVGQEVLKSWPRESVTNKMLYEIWKIKEPDQWFFGHYHKSFNKKISNTNFRCLNINEEYVIEI